MVLVTLLWSMAGIVSRQIDLAQGLTLTFWRSAFNGLALMLILGCIRGPARMLASLIAGRWPLWASGMCWAVMFTAFMSALTMTTIANVLVTMAVGPLITALMARAWLGRSLTPATLAAVIVAGFGLGLMQMPALMQSADVASNATDLASGTAGASQDHVLGLILALAVPTAGALNWVLIRGVSDSTAQRSSSQPDFLLSICIGAVLSALIAAPASDPLQVSISDLGWLGLLGVFQLAVPCLLAVRVAAVLQPSEVALLSLLEVLFGVAWAWVGTAEKPQPLVVMGGTIVLCTLVLHEYWQGRHRPLRT
jgi:drug/metabolite transporter (DMT)-like permease